MGKWIYYSSLMSLREISSRVSYAKELHTSHGLSSLIQRALKERRSPEIADYLRNQPERFFNSLVVATYGGQPNWHGLDDVRSNPTVRRLPELSPGTIASVGFLTLRGDEKLFALDGQHRLAGIKKAVQDGMQEDEDDEVSIIFVAHSCTPSGLERSRRLFTTLNKTARAVSKGDIIALDEDDVMAICVRRLIEETDLFREERVAFVANNNMPAANKVALTTIGNLYDVLSILFRNQSFSLRKARLADLQLRRPPEDELQRYFEYAREFFLLLRDNFGELAEFFGTTETRPVVSRHRGSHGGSVLFRPIGLEVFARLTTELAGEMGLSQAVRTAAKLPRELDREPYRRLLWDPSTQTILGRRHIVTLREILFYMVGGRQKYSPEELTVRYRRDTDRPTARLPATVV